jgi:branched-subunit amino acid aminotransferase/4-amino-4-deoxychorismate lyase
MVGPFHVSQNSVLRIAKTLSFALEMATRKLAYSQGFDDAILMNDRGYIAEATSANIFWVKNNKLYTPSMRSGCLDGMTRRIVLDFAKKDKIQTVEKFFKIETLYGADEVFITSSLKLILPVIYIQKQNLHTGFKYRIGEMTTYLQNRLYDYIFKGD